MLFKLDYVWLLKVIWNEKLIGFGKLDENFKILPYQIFGIFRIQNYRNRNFSSDFQILYFSEFKLQVQWC